MDEPYHVYSQNEATDKVYHVYSQNVATDKVRHVYIQNVAMIKVRALWQPNSRVWIQTCVTRRTACENDSVDVSPVWVTQGWITKQHVRT